MNIVFLTRLFSPHIGGVEKHVLNLSLNLISKGHKITIITEQYDQSLSEFEIIQKIKVHRIPLNNCSEKNKKWIVWKWLRANNNLLLTAEIIHVHDVVFWLYPFKLLHPFKKIFATFHGWEEVYPIPKKNLLKKQIDAYICHKNISVGDFISKWYKIKTDIVTYGATGLPVSDKPPEKNTLLFLGRLTKNTGIIECIDLFEKYKPTLKWTMKVIGDGEYKKNLPKTIDYLGVIADPKVYIASSKYIFTSGYLGILEGFIHNKIVMSSYNNPIKKDYLELHPMAKYVNVSTNIPTSASKEAYNWAKQQTWDKLRTGYELLWKKSQ